MASVNTAKIPSSKGHVSVGIHTPESATGKLAVLCPGFVDSKDYQGLVGLANALCDEGYTVVRLDPTGTWASDGTIADYSTTQYLDDIRHVIDFMLEQGAYRTVLLGGHSRGAGTALTYAASDPRISLVVAIMPSTGMWLSEEKRIAWQSAGARAVRRDLPDGSPGERVFQVPYAFQEDRDGYDTQAAVRAIHVPILFIAGELDTLVIPNTVQALFEHANEPKQFTVVPGVGHDYRHHPAEIHRVNQVVQDWITTKG